MLRDSFSFSFFFSTSVCVGAGGWGRACLLLILRSSYVHGHPFNESYFSVFTMGCKLIMIL